MKLLALAFPAGEIAKQAVSQLPWGHIICLLQMVKEPAMREFYIRQTIAHGWSPKSSSFAVCGICCQSFAQESEKSRIDIKNAI